MEYQDDGGFSEDLKNHDAPCVVCNAETRTRQIMIPGKESCPQGWVREYYGWLVAQQYNDGASTFACLDVAMEKIAGSASDQQGGLFHLVEAVCGSLQCPPYVDGRELACVVCTK